MQTLIHVNQHVIKANRNHNENNPPLTVKTYKENRRAMRADIVDAFGNVLASVVYEPEKPLSCGAHVWVETELEVRVS